MLGYVLTALLLVGTSGSPMFKNLQNLNSPCVMKCLANVSNKMPKMDFSKMGNFVQQFASIDDETCELIANARDCVAKCNISANPFDMKAMRLMCSKEKLAELKKHSVCYNEQRNATIARCDKMCGSLNEAARELKQTVVLSNDTNGSNVSALLNSMGHKCDIAKCHVRCSVDAFNELCRNTDPKAGTFMKQFTEDILKAASDDLDQLGMKTVMKNMLPKQCHFILSPGQLFNDTETSSYESSGK